jgi:hypothetical protein
LSFNGLAMSRPKPIAANQLAANVSPPEAELNCTVQHPVDLTSVRQLHRDLLNVEKAQRMAEFFSLLGDANRLRLLSALGNTRAMRLRSGCCCKDVGISGVTPASGITSHAFSQLSQAGSQRLLLP